MTTVLKLSSKALKTLDVEEIAYLHGKSANNIDRCYTALASLGSASFNVQMITKTPRVRRDREDLACDCCYCENGKAGPLPFVLGKQKMGQTYDPVQRGGIVELYDPSRDRNFWWNMSDEVVKDWNKPIPRTALYTEESTWDD